MMEVNTLPRSEGKANFTSSKQSLLVTTYKGVIVISESCTVSHVTVHRRPDPSEAMSTSRSWKQAVKQSREIFERGLATLGRRFARVGALILVRRFRQSSFASPRSPFKVSLDWRLAVSKLLTSHWKKKETFMSPLPPRVPKLNRKVRSKELSEWVSDVGIIRDGRGAIGSWNTPACKGQL